MQILLAEDDHHIGDGLCAGMQAFGFQVDWFQRGACAYAASETIDYDAAVLDLGLPDIDGIEILTRWREAGNTLPVLILTARDAIPDRIAGLNVGADDYLGKPFDIEEVVARLHAIIRRHHGEAHNRIQHGALSVDMALKSVWLENQPLTLSHREWLLLELLLLNKSRVLSRAQIEAKLYDWNQEIESNAIEVHIHNLRKKLGKSAILTRRGLGYQLGEISAG